MFIPFPDKEAQALLDKARQDQEDQEKAKLENLKAKLDNNNDKENVGQSLDLSIKSSTGQEATSPSKKPESQASLKVKIETNGAKEDRQATPSPVPPLDDPVSEQRRRRRALIMDIPSHQSGGLYNKRNRSSH